MYDPSMIVGNGRGFTGNEDYTHYPYPDEYLNERNRQYLGTNGDPYAAVNKPQRPPTEYSQYGDVSGLPDPFSTAHEVVDHSGKPIQQHPMQHMTFEESLGESGYSTPNSRSRRIIREIIV
jgi:echinoid protein